MATIHSVCVFCGSRTGNVPEHARAAQHFGTALAQRGWRLVYGGGNVGIMGIVADAVLAAGGEVIGVIPQGLVDRELAHTGVTDLRIVDSMHARKALMAELSDAFVALPGGIGTFEELFEIATWAQLEIHNKPIALLNLDNYYTPLVEMLQRAVDAEFMTSTTQAIIQRYESVAEIFSLLDEWQVTTTGNSDRLAQT